MLYVLLNSTIRFLWHFPVLFVQVHVGTSSLFLLQVLMCVYFAPVLTPELCYNNPAAIFRCFDIKRIRIMHTFRTPDNRAICFCGFRYWQCEGLIILCKQSPFNGLSKDGPRQ